MSHSTALSSKSYSGKSDIALEILEGIAARLYAKHRMIEVDL